MHARSSLLKHKHCNTRNSALSRTMPRARQGNAPTSKQSNHISLHHDTVRGPSMPCMCWWREKAKRALLEDFSPAPCFTCSMLRDTTLCAQMEAQLLRSRTYAHALFSSNQYRNTQAAPIEHVWKIQQKKPEYAKM
jgi:hypothetical protein